MVGQFDLTMLDSVDADGVTAARSDADGWIGSSGDSSAALPAQDLLGYVEVHIEQGPVLLNEEVPLGVGPPLP